MAAGFFSDINYYLLVQNLVDSEYKMNSLWNSVRNIFRKSFVRFSEIESKGPESGSGQAGAIREAGGAFGKMQKAREEQYFHQISEVQTKKLKKKLEEEKDTNINSDPKETKKEK